MRDLHRDLVGPGDGRRLGGRDDQVAGLVDLAGQRLSEACRCRSPWRQREPRRRRRGGSACRSAAPLSAARGQSAERPAVRSGWSGSVPELEGWAANRCCHHKSDRFLRFFLLRFFRRLRIGRAADDDRQRLAGVAGGARRGDRDRVGAAAAGGGRSERRSAGDRRRAVAVVDEAEASRQHAIGLEGRHRVAGRSHGEGSRDAGRELNRFAAGDLRRGAGVGDGDLQRFRAVARFAVGGDRQVVVEAAGGRRGARRRGAGDRRGAVTVVVEGESARQVAGLGQRRPARLWVVDGEQPAAPVVKPVVAALVMNGASPGLKTVRVKLWVAAEPTPLVAFSSKV